MINSGQIKVSVVVPIYNAYDYLRPSLDSILDQSLRDIEVICVDDGSVDHSLDVLKEYQRADERVRIITENNAGPSMARNKGLKRARGEFVIFLDADDFYEPDLLESLYTLACERGLDIAVSDFDIYNSHTAKFESKINADHGEVLDGGAIISKSTHPDQIFQCVTNYVWNKLFRHSFLVDKELSFDEELRVFEDTHFVMTSLSLASAIGRVDKVMVHHRVYAEQSKPRLFKKYFRQVPVTYVKIKEFLMRRGMYAPLSGSFLNLSASRAYKIYNLLRNDVKDDFWDLYHSGYAELLGWNAAEPEDFEETEVRDFVASAIMYTHAQQQRRVEAGRAVRIDRVGPSIRSMKLRKRIKAFFASIFSKKG